jgi:NAD(P)-dependent dehydrogenase (short-subunit alcohol dehydrogenase family)
MGLVKYLVQYRFHQMRELFRNEKKSPLDCTKSLRGKTAVITGATSGIGLETARLFAEKGASLICINRNIEKSENLERELRERYGCKIQTIITDFSSLDQVRTCIETLMNLKDPLDIIIHNAGVFLTKKSFSQDKIELVFHINHISSFLINYRLKERLKNENRARIIYVNSEGHRFALGGVHLNDLEWKWHHYSGLKSYGAAKTAQLLTMLQFNRYFSGSSVTINAMHPGNVKSNIGNNNGKWYRYMKKRLILPTAKDPVQSAKALLYLAASDEMTSLSGGFYNLTTKETPAPHAIDESQVNNVWLKSLELCRKQLS